MNFTVSIDTVKALFPQFKIISALTPSAFKAAFQVEDKDGNQFCLKLINPNSTSERIDRELIALQKASHPNLAKLVEYAFVSRRGQIEHYFIEEFIGGDDLTSRLGVKWTREAVSKIFSQICLGLDQLRQLNIVHRDLKPSNIRIQPDDTPVIIDFGLARHLGLPHLTSTGTGARIGTPAYFAPEQCEGKRTDIDHRTDIFAMGIIIYEALTGTHPFLNSTNQNDIDKLYESICHSEEWKNNVEWISLPPSWKIILETLLAKERSERPFQATQVAKLLNKLENI